MHGLKRLILSEVIICDRERYRDRRIFLPICMTKPRIRYRQQGTKTNDIETTSHREFEMSGMNLWEMSVKWDVYLQVVSDWLTNSAIRKSIG